MKHVNLQANAMSESTLWHWIDEYYLKGPYSYDNLDFKASINIDKLKLLYISLDRLIGHGFLPLIHKFWPHISSKFGKIS